MSKSFWFFLAGLSFMAAVICYIAHDKTWFFVNGLLCGFDVYLGLRDND